ncbi:MAG: hypothetical protein ACR2KJ_08830 [Jatrophihabitans sp.]
MTNKPEDIEPDTTHQQRRGDQTPASDGANPAEDSDGSPTGLPNPRKTANPAGREHAQRNAEDEPAG